MTFKSLKLMPAFAALAVVASAGTARAEWPEREITFIVPYNPGGSTDPVSRVFADQLSKVLGVGVIVENRPGASATLGTGAVLRSEPDGYTIGLGSNSSLAHQPLEKDNLEWKTPADYDTVVKLAELPSVLYVKQDAPWQTFEEFLAAVREKPGEIRLSTSGLRTIPDLVVNYFDALAGTHITTVPFTGGGGEALTAVLSGRVEGSAGYGPSIKGYVDAGQVRPIGVFSTVPYSAFPDVLPIGTTGIEANIPANYYVVAPNGLPDDVRTKLVAASEEVVKGAAFKEFSDKNLYIVPDPDGAKAEAELEAFQKIFQTTLDFIKGREK